MRSLALLMALAGCGSTCAARTPAAAAHDAGALALVDPGGDAPVDAQVRAAVARVKQVPKSTDRWVELGRAWVLKARHSGHPGWYRQAQACAERVLEQEPNSRLARELLAQVALSEHRFADAAKLCEEVLAADPEAVIALGTYSDALLELGRVDEAMKAADQMVTFKPGAASYVRVSYFQWLSGDVDAALRSVKAAIEAGNDPQLPEPKAYALVQAAGYFFNRGDYEGAAEGYAQALAVLPSYAPALLGLGRAALAVGDLPRAVSSLEASLATSPQCETAWRLSDARAALGDREGSEQALARAVELGRRGDGRTLAMMYAVKNREPGEAVKLAEAELKTRPGPYTQAVSAWALYRAGRLEEAATRIASATRYGTRDPQLWWWSGAIAVARGERQAGRARITEALALSPAFDLTGAAEARGLLTSLERR